ncbi:hypothetical protein D3C79_1006850 [compost metagenome]
MCLDQIPHLREDPGLVDLRHVERYLAAGEGLHIDLQSVLLGQYAHYLASRDATIGIELLPIEG